MNDNKEFLELLNSVIDEKKFVQTLTDGNEYSFRLLKTIELRDIIKSVLDSPITQALFNTTLSKLFKSSLLDQTEKQFNAIDRIVFFLSTRVNAVSEHYSIVINDDTKETKTVNLNEHINKLLLLSKEADLLTEKQYTENNLTITYGIPSLNTEDKLNKEIYSKFKPNLEKEEELRNLIGDIFVNEIAKCIKVLKIDDKELVLDTIPFEQRIKIIEKLPAQTISKIFEFVEKYKKIIKEALTVVEEVTIPIDGSLFSLR